MPTKRIDVSDAPFILFFLGCLLAPGAWLIWTLPEVPIAQFCFVATALVAGACASVGLLPILRPSKSALIVGGLVTGALLVALLANPYPFQQFFYDIYGEMPTYVWLCYPAVFLLASSLRFSERVHTAINVLCLVGCALIVVALFQRFWNSWVTVFGSIAYTPVALIPVPVLMLGLASSSRRDARWWYAGALVAFACIALFSYGLLGLYCVVLALGAVSAFAPHLLVPSPHTAHTVPRMSARANVPAQEGRPLLRWNRRAGIVLLVATIGATLFVSIPALSGRLITLEQARSFEQTAGSRIELWHGAQDMFVARPLFGYGPSGFRLSAVRFVPPQVFDRIAQLGDDPVGFSPPSPHSLLWEVLTRVGLVGFVSLCGAVFVWGRKVFELTSHSAPPADVDERNLRLACAIGAFTFASALLVTPFHFASGLIGALCAGLAIAHSAHPAGADADGRATKDTARDNARAERPLPMTLGRIALFALCCILLAGFAFLTVQQTRLASEVDSANTDLVRLQQVARFIKGHPFIERRILECRLMIADSMEESDAILREALASPGYISGYGPNLVRFARIGFDNAQYFGSENLEVIAEVMRRAEQLMPISPPMAEVNRLLSEYAPPTND